MTATTFFIPSLNLFGAGCVSSAADHAKARGFKRALIVTDSGLHKLGVADQIASMLIERSVTSVVFPGAKPNPTIKNVEDGLALLRQENCDCVISLGGGSAHDCAKGIALTATNGGSIKDYEGVDKSEHAQLPLIAVNTTAGTASEMTRFCIITDEERQVKMAIVDRHTTPLLSVNDPVLMLGKPPALTAATGMDALTHAIEAYVSIAATPITDACALKAMSIISNSLRTVVAEGQNLVAREAMSYAGFLAGMAFNNASLGYVHAMAHQLGGFYDLPHGVCNAVLLPHVQAYNAQVAAGRLKDVAHALGVDTTGMTDAQGADAAIHAIQRLSADVGIPSGLGGLGMKETDVPILAANALKDACGFTNPKQATQTEIETIFRAAA